MATRTGSVMQSSQTLWHDQRRIQIICKDTRANNGHMEIGHGSLPLVRVAGTHGNTLAKRYRWIKKDERMSKRAKDRGTFTGWDVVKYLKSHPRMILNGKARGHTGEAHPSH